MCVTYEVGLLHQRSYKSCSYFRMRSISSSLTLQGGNALWKWGKCKGSVQVLLDLLDHMHCPSWQGHKANWVCQVHAFYDPYDLRIISIPVIFFCYFILNKLFTVCYVLCVFSKTCIYHVCNCIIVMCETLIFWLVCCVMMWHFLRFNTFWHINL